MGIAKVTHVLIYQYNSNVLSLRSEAIECAGDGRVLGLRVDD